MADANQSIFNKKAAEKLRSADDLEKYVRVTNPSGWIVVGAILALVAGLLAWGFFGSVSTSISSKGVMTAQDSDEMRVECFLAARDMANVKVGDMANVDGISTSISEIQETPLSNSEARQLMMDYQMPYLMSIVPQSDWLYRVAFEVDDFDEYEVYDGVPLDIVITTGGVTPIEKLLG